MPIEKTAYKELRKAKLRHFKNVSTKTEIKTLTKGFEKLVADKKPDEAKKALGAVISKIDKAVKKIKEDTYGYCEETGEEIGLKRLMARPIATLTVEAQERHEREEKIFADS